MRLITTFLSTIALFLTCCHGHDHPNDQHSLADTHFLNYQKLKIDNPDTALVELKAHAKIVFKAHPKSVEWAEVASRLDRAGKSSLPDMQFFNQIVLDIEMGNNASPDKIQKLQDDLDTWKEIERELKDDGIDPTTYFLKFRLARKK